MMPQINLLKLTFINAARDRGACFSKPASSGRIRSDNLIADRGRHGLARTDAL
jgi:hypothetical protein